MRRLALGFGSSGLAFAVLASSGWTLGGCSSSSSSTSAATSTSSCTLKPNSVVVMTDAMATDSTSVTFPANAETQSLKIGDVIIAGNQHAELPYLRQVTGTTTANGQVKVATTNASFDDFFEDVDINEMMPFTAGADDSATTDPMPALSTDGISPLLPTPIETLTPLDFDPLPGGGKEFSLANGKKGYIALDGTAHLDLRESYFRLSGGLEFVYQKRSSINVLPQHLRMVMHGGLALNVGGRLMSEGAVSYESPKLMYTPEGGIEIAHFVFVIPSPIGVPIPIPVGVDLVFNGQAQVGVSAATNVHDAINLTATLAGGFDYTQGGGTQGVAQVSKHLTVASLSGELEGSLKATVYPLNTEVHFNFFGFPDTGPYIALDPYVSFTVSAPVGGGGGLVMSASSRTTAKGSLGLLAKVGGDITIFDHTITDVNAVLFDASHEVPICLGNLVCAVETAQ